MHWYQNSLPLKKKNSNRILEFEKPYFPLRVFSGVRGIYLGGRVFLRGGIFWEVFSKGRGLGEYVLEGK